MSAPPETLSREQIQKELKTIQRRAIWIMLVSFAGLLYFIAISPFVPSGPLLVPALGFHLADLPTLPWIGAMTYLIYLSLKGGKRSTALRSQLTKLAVADTASGPISGPSSLGPLTATTGAQRPTSEEIVWFPNRARTRVRFMAKLGAGILAVDAALIVILAAASRSNSLGPWGSWAFSGVFTPLVFGLIMLGVGLSSLRTEPLRIGVSAGGAHRDLPASLKDQNLRFIPWSFVDSAQDFGSDKERGVMLKTKDGKSIALATSAEGAEALLSSYERWRAPTAVPSPGRVSVSAESTPAATALGCFDALSDLPGSTWRPNSLRRMWMTMGLILLGLGVALTPILGPYMLHPRTAAAGLYLGLAYLIGLIVVASSWSFPSAVAVGPTGFLVRSGGKVAGLRFADVIGIATPGFPLECTLTTGRTMRFQSLGPREKRKIQEAYRAFREQPSEGTTPRPSVSASVIWMQNPARWPASARFFLPLIIPVVAAAFIVLVYLSDPRVYFDYLVGLPLAMLPTPLALFTIRAYRRAPKQVGLSDRGIEVRYPHHLYPAVALERVDWSDLERVAGPHGRAFRNLFL